MQNVHRKVHKLHTFPKAPREFPHPLFFHLPCSKPDRTVKAAKTIIVIKQSRHMLVALLTVKKIVKKIGRKKLTVKHSKMTGIDSIIKNCKL